MNVVNYILNVVNNVVNLVLKCGVKLLLKCGEKEGPTCYREIFLFIFSFFDKIVVNIHHISIF